MTDGQIAQRIKKVRDSNLEARARPSFEYLVDDLLKLRGQVVSWYLASYITAGEAASALGVTPEQFREMLPSGTVDYHGGDSLSKSDRDEVIDGWHHLARKARINRAREDD